MSKLIRPDDFYGRMKRNAIFIPEDDQVVLEKHAKAIREIKHRSRKAATELVLKIGAELAAAQFWLAKHGDGTFGKWVAERCGISKSTAYRAIAVHAAFGDRPTVGQTFEATALYLLSADSTPEDATEAALELADKGELITTKRAREIIRQHTDQVEDDQAIDDDFDQDGQVVKDQSFDPCQCLLDVRTAVMRWKEICTSSDLPALKQVLLDLVEQIDAAGE